jgi:hypothetical protein
MNGNHLTPKPVRRTLFPSAHEGPLKALGEAPTNSPRRSPRIASRGSEKAAQDKENRVPAAHDNLDDLFEGPFDMEPPTTPTPKRRSPREGAATERRLSLPFTSPTARKGKDANHQTPSRLAQRTQGTSPAVTPRGRNDEHSIAELASLGDTPRTREMMNGIMDIFDDDITQTNSMYNFEPSKSPSGNWVDWEPSDYVSPIESEIEANGNTQQQHGEGNSVLNSTAHDEDLIRAILSDPDIHNGDIHVSEFDSLLFGDDPSGMDSHDFGSKNGDSGLTGLGVTSSTSNQKEGEVEASTSAST